MDKVKTQERGRVRRRNLMNAAETLLEQSPLDQLTLGEVALKAGVPKASAYNFYSDIYALYAEMSAVIGDGLADVISDFPLPATVSWENVVADALSHGSAYIDATASRRELIWGSKVPSEIKRSDRANDRRIGRIVLARISERFSVPEFPRQEEIFYHSVEIADLFFSLCLIENARLTNEALVDAQRAAISYLRIYLPSVLPLKV